MSLNAKLCKHTTAHCRAHVTRREQEGRGKGGKRASGALRVSLSCSSSGIAHAGAREYEAASPLATSFTTVPLLKDDCWHPE